MRGEMLQAAKVVPVKTRWLPKAGNEQLAVVVGESSSTGSR